MSDKFDPLRELNSLRETVEKALQEGSTVAGKIINQGIQTVQSATNASPLRFDIYELNNEVIIRAAPIDGVMADSIEVSMEGTTLTISLQTQADEVSPKASYVLHERKFGVFSRQIQLEIPVHANQARAKFNKDGTLTITMPIDLEAQAARNLYDE
jgi:HSP20 family molecular chaperone IbpA